jgi:pimeloyl-ACP methyl ester carboxylesterase
MQPIPEESSSPARQVPQFLPHEEIPWPSPILSEPLCVLEMMTLHVSPEYYGLDVPRGDGSAVVLIPGLLGMDVNLFELYAWLVRIGYRPHYSGIGVAAACPNKLSRQLDETIQRAYAETGRRVHIIGHGLGGIFARSAAVRTPRRIASVITLGSPYRGIVAHRLVLAVSNSLRGWIRDSEDVALECGTSRCPCEFGRSLGRKWPRSVRQTAVYTRCDGVVDWRYTLSGKPEIDVEVVGTHIGLPFNANVYSQIARRLADPGPGTA